MIADHLEGDVGEVDLLADDARVQGVGAFGGDGGDAAEAGTTGVEGVEPFGGCGDVAVFLSELAFGELAHVGGVFGGCEGAVWRGEELGGLLEAALADGEGGGGFAREGCMARESGGRSSGGVEPPQDGLHGGEGQGKRRNTIYPQWGHVRPAP